jgi:hypothetical protein
MYQEFNDLDLEKEVEFIKDSLAEFNGTMSLLELALDDIMDGGDTDPQRTGEMVGQAFLKFYEAGGRIEKIIESLQKGD